MNRRAFVRRTLGALAAAVFVPALPVKPEPFSAEHVARLFDVPVGMLKISPADAEFIEMRKIDYEAVVRLSRDFARVYEQEAVWIMSDKAAAL